MADITLILPELCAKVKASFKYPLEITFAFYLLVDLLPHLLPFFAPPNLCKQTIFLHDTQNGLGITMDASLLQHQPHSAVQQAGGDKVPNYLGRNATLFQVGIDTAPIYMPGRQHKGFLGLRGLFVGLGFLGGGISGTVVKGQQVLHRLWETLIAKMLQEGDGVPTNLLGVAIPGAAVLDPQAVHLLGGVVLNVTPNI